MEDMIKKSLTAMEKDVDTGTPLLERTLDAESVHFEEDLRMDSNLVAKKFNMHKHTFTC